MPAQRAGRARSPTSQAFGFPCVLKTTRGGYDGKGVWFVDGPRTAPSALRRPRAGVRSSPRSGSTSAASSSALVARSPSRPGRGVPGRRLDPARRHLPRGDRPGARTSTPTSPAQAQQIAMRIAGELDVTGVLAVELFETTRRPGAGQRAGDAAAQHRALDPGRRGHQPVREPPARRARPAARLARAPGAVDGDGQHPRRPGRRPAGSTTATRTRWPATRACGCTSTARSCGPGRKVGHVNAYGDDLDDCLERARHAAAWFARRPGRRERVTVSDRRSPRTRRHRDGVRLRLAGDEGRRRGAARSSTSRFEADVVSAHRMPDEMLAYGREAAGRGLQVIIAGAGGRRPPARACSPRSRRCR